VPEERLVRSSAIFFFGGGISRLLGFLFSVASARLLGPTKFGLLAYALAIVNVASVLITNAPAGLARFIARQHGDRRGQDAHFSNWVMVILAMLVVSLVLVIPIALIAGLNGWMLIGVMANLVGLAVFYTYREAQRGLERFGAMTVFYMAGNLIQLVAILVLAAWGWRSPALFLMVYGLSFGVPLLFMHPLRPMAVSFARESISRQRMIAVARYIRPAVLQTIFFAVWFGADLILVERLLGLKAAGNYAAAKTLAIVVSLPPNAIASVLVSRVARLSEPRLRKDLLRVMALALGITAPAFAALTILRDPIIAIVFGAKYPHAAEPLVALALGMGLYGIYLILESTWQGLGRPKVDAIATGAGMVCTVALGFILIAPAGLTGAAIAFAAGAAVQVAVIGGVTVWAMYLGAVPRLGHLAEREFLHGVSRDS